MHFEMHRKKQLKLNKKEYPELSAPIDIDKNSELDYFSELGSLEKIYQMINSKMRNLDVSSNKR